MSPDPLTYRLWRLALVVFGAGGLVLALLWLLGQPVQVARAGGDWYVDPQGDDSNQCTIPQGGACLTLAGAAGRADAGGTIHIAAGNYAGVVTLTKALTFLGAGSGSTTVDGGSNDRAFNTAADISLSDLTIQYGSGNDAQGGGGVHTSGAMTLTNVIFFGNTSAGSGGGAASFGPATVSNCLFQSNSASPQDSGGGLYVGGTLLLADTQFIGNTAGHGGGLRVVGAATLTGGLFQDNASTTGTDFSDGGLYADDMLIITGTQFIGNSGGGAYAFGPVRVSGGRFDSNTCSNCNGGGLASNADLSLSASEFTGNVAGASGGGGGGAFGRNGAADYAGLFQNNSCTGVNCTGGGLFSYGPLTLEGTRFVSNTAVYGGGAFAQSDTVLMHALFDHNQSVQAGGGLYVNTAATGGSSTLFISNTATSGKGGGLYTNYSVNLSDSQFISNTAGAGGGGAYALGAVSLIGGKVNYNHSGGPGGGLFTETNLDLANTEFIGNTSLGDGGGAGAETAVTVWGSLFRDNTCTGDSCLGGGLRAYDGLSLMATQFISNSAAYGGGLFNRNFLNPGSVVNTLFARNSARTGGSAMYVSGNATIQFTTIAGPTPASGAGIYVTGGNVAITDTLITHYMTGVQQAAGTVLADYNLYFGNTADKGGTVGGGAHDRSGDPLFVNPAKDDYHLTYGSPAIDHGLDVGVSNDLDGTHRPTIAGFDIGAYEYASPVALAGDPQTVRTRSLVTLDGSESFDPGGALPLAYRWAQTGGLPVVLSSAVVSRPTFTAPGVTVTSLLTFNLTVTNTLHLPNPTPAQTVIIVVPYHVFLPFVRR